MTETSTPVKDRIPISISHPSNRFWAATSIAGFGWVVTIRIRRKGERQRYRRWVNLEIFNYNYSEEAKAASREKNEILGRPAFPNDGRNECYQCGQEEPHGHEDKIPAAPYESNALASTVSDREES